MDPTVVWYCKHRSTATPSIFPTNPLFTAGPEHPPGGPRGFKKKTTCRQWLLDVTSLLGFLGGSRRRDFRRLEHRGAWSFFEVSQLDWSYLFPLCLFVVEYTPTISYHVVLKGYLACRLRPVLLKSLWLLRLPASAFHRWPGDIEWTPNAVRYVDNWRPASQAREVFDGRKPPEERRGGWEEGVWFVLFLLCFVFALFVCFFCALFCYTSFWLVCFVCHAFACSLCFSLLIFCLETGWICPKRIEWRKSHMNTYMNKSWPWPLSIFGLVPELMLPALHFKHLIRTMPMFCHGVWRGFVCSPWCTGLFDCFVSFVCFICFVLFCFAFFFSYWLLFWLFCFALFWLLCLFCICFVLHWFLLWLGCFVLFCFALLWLFFCFDLLYFVLVGRLFVWLLRRALASPLAAARPYPDVWWSEILLPSGHIFLLTTRYPSKHVRKWVFSLVCLHGEHWISSFSGLGISEDERCWLDPATEQHKEVTTFWHLQQPYEDEQWNGETKAPRGILPKYNGRSDFLCFLFKQISRPLGTPGTPPWRHWWLGKNAKNTCSPVGSTPGAATPSGTGSVECSLWKSKSSWAPCWADGRVSGVWVIGEVLPFVLEGKRARLGFGSFWVVDAYVMLCVFCCILFDRLVLVTNKECDNSGVWGWVAFALNRKYQLGGLNTVTGSLPSVSLIIL